MAAVYKFEFFKIKCGTWSVCCSAESACLDGLLVASVISLSTLRFGLALITTQLTQSEDRNKLKRPD